MTIERKILYSLGSLIIAGMIAVGSFSLGIYVGKSGWSINQPSLLNPQAEPGNIQNPDHNQPDNLPPKPDLIGRAISITADTITLSTPNGPRSISINEETVFLRQEGGTVKPASLEDIHAGNNLAIIGKLDPDNRLLRGEIVVILPGNK